MTSRLWVSSLFTVCMVLMASLATAGLAQSERKNKSADASEKPAVTTGSEQGDSDEYVKEIEPGVTVYGRSNRFAEVGHASSFDSSPDGRTLAFASSKIKFFDLVENKITDTIGEDGEHYSIVRYSPDGRFVFAAGQGGKGGSMVRVFDAIDMTSVGTISSKVEPEKEKEKEKSDDEDEAQAAAQAFATANYFHLQSIAVSADAKYIAMNSHDSIQVRDVKSGELVHHVKKAGYVQSSCFTADEKYLVYPKNYQIAVLDLETGEEQTKKDFPIVGQQGYYMSENIARNQVVLPTGGALAIYGFGDDDRDAKILTMPSGHYPQMARFSDDGQMLAVSTYQNGKMALVVLDVNKKKPVAEVSVVAAGQLNARFSGDNKLLFVSGNGISGVKEISLGKDAEVKETKHPSGPATSLALHPEGESFLTVTGGGEISWFDMKTGNVERSINSSSIKSIHFNESGSEVLLATAMNPTTGLTTHSFKTGKQIKPYSLKSPAKTGSVFSQIKKFMRSEDSMTNRDHRQEYSIDGCYSPDCSKIYAVGMTMVYRYEIVSEGTSSYSQTQEYFITFFEFDTETGKRKAGKSVDTEILGFQNGQWPQTVTPSPLGDQFAIVNGKKVHLVDSSTGEIIADFEVEFSHVSAISYSPDGRFLAINGHGGFAVVNANNGEEVYSDSDLSSVKFGFSKNGKRMAISSSQKKSKIEVLNTDTWKSVLSRAGTQGDRSSLALSNDGMKVLIGLSDCRVEYWDLAKLSRRKDSPEPIK